MSISTTTPHAIPTKNDPELTGVAHNDVATPVSVATISSLDFAGAGEIWSGAGTGASLAFAGRLLVKNVIPKIDKAVPNQKR